MHSEKYHQYRKEFINCLILSPITLFVSTVLAFTEWKPKMDEELRKEREQA